VTEIVRNLLLYALLESNELTKLIWNIFFHFTIHYGATALFVQQRQTLIDAPSSMDTWTQSTFGYTYKYTADTPSPSSAAIRRST
jgi:hypothetical protein